MRHDLLETTARLAARRHLEQTASTIVRATQLCRSDRLVAGLRGRFQRSRPKRGDSTGPNPTDRGKAGTKHPLATDRTGIPLVVQLAAANQNETTLFPAMIDALPTLARKRGRPKWKPDKVHADKGYDSHKNRAYLESLNIKPRIARRGIESSEKLGKHRWVVERTFAWLHRFRRLRIRYERSDEIHKAFLLLGCALICCKALARGK